MRTLEEIANATPTDYLNHKPKDPTGLAMQMIAKAERLFPKNTDSGDMVDPTYSFLFIGPGAGLVVAALIAQEQRARGVETSKRGIASAPENIWSYIGWKKPWELSQGNKAVDVCLVNKYLKTLLLPDEWSRTVKEVERVSKYQALI
jgi:hypothetical protein